MATPTTGPGQHKFEKNNPDRQRTQRGSKIHMKDAKTRRKKKAKKRR